MLVFKLFYARMNQTISGKEEAVMIKIKTQTTTKVKDAIAVALLRN